MRSKLSGAALVLCLGAAGAAISLASPTVLAQPRTKKPPADVAGDRSLEKQSAWEQKVMGDDSGKKADMKKIAAAQKLADEARKNPPPEPPKKYKDPNKEGARAKSEAAIGLPIASEEAERAQPNKAKVKTPVGNKAKALQPSAGSAHDELGALVADSLASDRKAGSSVSAAAPTERARPGKERGSRRRSAPSAAAAPSSLDRMFSAGK